MEAAEVQGWLLNKSEVKIMKIMLGKDIALGELTKLIIVGRF